MDLREEPKVQTHMVHSLGIFCCCLEANVVANTMVCMAFSCASFGWFELLSVFIVIVVSLSCLLRYCYCG